MRTEAAGNDGIHRIARLGAKFPDRVRQLRRIPGQRRKHEIDSRQDEPAPEIALPVQPVDRRGGSGADHQARARNLAARADQRSPAIGAETLETFGVAYEKRIVSAHRTPDLLAEYAKTAKSRGIEVIIAGAGGAAHLPGMVASMTTLPVVGVPVKSKALNGLDSLLSIVQMPAGVPVATVAINGAKNAALVAVSILALHDEALALALEDFRRRQTETVLMTELQ